MRRAIRLGHGLHPTLTLHSQAERAFPAALAQRFAAVRSDGHKALRQDPSETVALSVNAQAQIAPYAFGSLAAELDQCGQALGIALQLALRTRVDAQQHSADDDRENDDYY